ncbi:MAG: hypothetical protein IKG11_05055 [Atopobiaceae bacterium]|nr:hypothetical protein [Atopobiaceae bacterium]
MSICLCNASADKALELFAHKGIEMEPVSSSCVTQFRADFEGVWIPSYLADVFSDGIEVLVGDGGAPRENDMVVCHRWTGRLPEGALLRAPNTMGLYVSSPAFCLMQQASELHMINLCMMLGRYLATKSPTMGKNGQDVLEDRLPLIKEDDLYRFVKGASGARGVGQLREALRWTCAGAASPQEINLQLALSLPPSYYGFGLALPQMNYSVPLDEYAKKFYARKECRIDLCWPERFFGLEYLGKDHEKQIEDDCSRHYALCTEGYELLYVTNGQLSSAVQMDYIARWVARKTRKHVREEVWPSINEVQRLLDILGKKVTPRQDERKRHTRQKKSVV